MSWTHFSSNMFYPYLPPFMDDGRNFTTYFSENYLNNKIKQENNIKENWQYRKFLQNNANQIIQFNSTQTLSHLGSNSFRIKSKPYSMNTMYPSDLKQMYLTREQLSANRMSPSIPIYLHK